MGKPGLCRAFLFAARLRRGGFRATRLPERACGGGSAFRCRRAARHPRNQFVAGGTIRHAPASRLRRPEKKKAPEGAFNRLRLVRQAD
ncbi:hypothetical protein DF051_05500 [Burkholderia contaminans]|uniref:Uncharacterized protein n=1 Tax=Burkholderia contaminans TaxID=488447 RepID=A0A3N8Q959_9BURK|nr:hypothetical protein DF051_05500 [Burkholderia contaminans]